MSWLGTFPLWIIGLFTLLALTGAVVLGYVSHILLHGKAGPEGESALGASHLLSAVLGLLALLLGFSFSIAMNRYDTRRDLVVQEANAIGTTWLRVQLLDEPERTQMSGLLRRYVDTRLLWSETEKNAPVEDSTKVLQQQLWEGTGRALRSESPPLLARGVMDSLNESFDLAAARKAARSAHIPDSVLYALLVFSLLSMVMMGAMLATTRKPHRTQTGLLLILLTLGQIIILDLDRPRTGTIQVSQQPLEALRDDLK